MREILFRGQAFGSREWIYGHYRNGRKVHIIYQDENSDNCYAVRPESICQFTGLTDKNGKKIFEGDIVRYMNKETMVVVWNKDSASFAIAYSAINFNYIATISSAHIYLEVIGNIHDNPELLKNP